jgi:large subunit ribosomal protein L21
MSYVVVEDRNKQYKVAEGDVVELDYISEAKAGQKVALKAVLASGPDGVKIGTPYLDSVAVKAVVKDPLIKADKVMSLRRIKMNDHRTRRGHRQKFTSVTIESIKM